VTASARVWAGLAPGKANNLKLLVFGKTGQVARALQRQCVGHYLDRSQADLSDHASCAAIIAATDADVVINAAAYTAVDTAEQEETLATLINGKTPGMMAQAAAARGLPFVHISTDYVFDGSGDTPWKPADTPAPLSAYGRSKLAGETAIRTSGARHVILRTSWVFSADGSNFVKTMLRLAETRAALNVVADQMGGPTPADDIATTLLTIARALLNDHSGGTYHYAGAPATNWECFARETFARAGSDMTVSAIATRDYPTPAQRPLNSRLDCSTLQTDFAIPPSDWQAGLNRVLNTLKEHSK
jgi:dTDP-4-dehydrorhamnose reductase